MFIICLELSRKHLVLKATLWSSKHMFYSSELYLKKKRKKAKKPSIKRHFLFADCSLLFLRPGRQDSAQFLGLPAGTQVAIEILGVDSRVNSCLRSLCLGPENSSVGAAADDTDFSRVKVKASGSKDLPASSPGRENVVKSWSPPDYGK